MQKRLFSLVTTMLITVSAVMAQVTTSSMSGKVTTGSAAGEEIIGATVLAVHEPSGTRYSAVTNLDGRFNIQGMRNGGPYAVTVSYIGYQTKVLRDITLQLGETYDLQVWLSENATELTEVVVTAKGSRFAGEKTGAAINISNNTIRELPTVNRSISDIARLSPYANGMGFAGGDGRSTNFTLDGANFNNNFGLSANLPGGGNPISIDAIDEVQVVVAPFDVRQSNFIGGGINAVTKSGTNTFRGTAYVYHTNEQMHGNRVDHLQMADPGKDRLTTYGVTLGGPIIKDKLFFFVNYEHSMKPTVTTRWRASEDGKADKDNYLSRTTQADMQRLSDFMKTKYGYDTGSWNSFPADESNDKLLARLDWNITDNHHLALRYNTTKNTSWSTVNGNSTQAYYRIRLDRMSIYSMAYANSMYSMDNKVSSWSADLNSRFGNNISNQLLFTHTNIEDMRGSDSSLFPFVDILAGYSVADDGTVKQTLEPYVSLGYELFSYMNGVTNKITNLTDNFSLTLPRHKILAGVSFEHQVADNSYLRGGTGYYRYRSLDDFMNGAAPETVAIDYGYNGRQATSNVTFNQLGIYLQDEWNATDRLKVTAGLRLDNLFFNDDDIITNNAIRDLDFGGQHIDTGRWPDAGLSFSPRFGFSWDILGDKTLKLRGGSGLFLGRLPLVFFTNMPAASAMIQNRPVLSTSYNSDGTVKSRDAGLDRFAGGLVTDVEQIRQLMGDDLAPATISPEQGLFQKSIAGVDSKFKMPQVWKSSIALDWQLPVGFPLTATAEFTYTRKINDVRLVNLNVHDDTSSWSRLSGADNRLVYPADYRYYNNVSDACVLTNTSRGHGFTANLTLNAEPLPGLNVMAAYTHTVMKEVSGMPGSNATSAWNGLYTIDGPNFGRVQNSMFVIPDRLIANISYKYGKDHYSLFYTGYTPAGTSFIYSGDVNGDGIASDLIYIPADDSEIHFTNDADRKDFWQFVNQDSYLSSHKGQYAEANSAHAPFVHRFDFRWAHDFDLKLGATTHRLQLILDAMNIGNMCSSRWGVEKNMLGSFSGQFLKVDKVENGVPYFSMRRDADGKAPTATYDYNHAYDQCWKLQVGLKYYFN
ncbi:MAG: TonB-dependent receptor [Prevotella sp.]|nr:TonB-dependent receptor [Prevotella sp.]